MDVLEDKYVSKMLTCLCSLRQNVIIVFVMAVTISIF